MNAKDAVQFMSEYQGDGFSSGFMGDFAENRPLRSVLQKKDVDLDKALEYFDWKNDCDEWVKEYKKGNNSNGEEQDIAKLLLYRRRVCFSVCAWREFNEDFGRCDVSCMRDIRTPFVTSLTPLKSMKDEFDD